MSVGVKEQDRYFIFSTNYSINPQDLLMAAKACESLLMEKENNPDLWLNDDLAYPANSTTKLSVPEGRKPQSAVHTHLAHTKICPLSYITWFVLCQCQE